MAAEKGALQVAKKNCKRVTPPLQLAMFLVVIVALQVARKIALCNMASNPKLYKTLAVKTLKQEKLKPCLTFNPGVALISF